MILKKNMLKLCWRVVGILECNIVASVYMIFFFEAQRTNYMLLIIEIV